MSYLINFWDALFDLTNEMSFWLLLGFLFAGLLNTLISRNIIQKYLGKNNIRSAINATLLGIPLPLCSCGVIPTGVAFFKNGASKPASVSFLISTPQTGVDSIMVTYSLLGLPFAIIRPAVAFITGIAGGIFSSMTKKKENGNQNVSTADSEAQKPSGNIFYRTLKYGFVDFLDDISKWLFIGLLVAAVIAVVVPDDFFVSHISNDFLEMLIILVASIPVYVCATGSVPIAAVLLMKGISPGAALVFLMAGPATNAATITVIGQSLGRSALFAYLFSITVGAIAGGLLINLLPSELFAMPVVGHSAGHLHFLPDWIMYGSSVLLVVLLCMSMYRKFMVPHFKNIKQKSKTATDMDIQIKVGGMTCNHCKANVETAIKKVSGVISIQADIDLQLINISGENIDLSEVKREVEDMGYKFLGQQ